MVLGRTPGESTWAPGAALVVERHIWSLQDRHIQGGPRMDDNAQKKHIQEDNVTPPKHHHPNRGQPWPRDTSWDTSGVECCARHNLPRSSGCTVRAGHLTCCPGAAQEGGCPPGAGAPAESWPRGEKLQSPLGRSGAIACEKLPFGIQRQILFRR